MHVSTTTRTAFVNGTRFAQGEKVIFGRNWAQTGVIEGFTDGVEPSALIYTSTGQLVWRSNIRPAR